MGIRAEDLTEEPALRAWLAARGVTGYAQSLLVMERFGYPDFLVASADALVDGQYADRPHLRPIFDAVISAAVRLGVATVQPRKTYVSPVSYLYTLRDEQRDDVTAECLRHLAEASGYVVRELCGRFGAPSSEIAQIGLVDMLLACPDQVFAHEELSARLRQPGPPTVLRAAATSVGRLHSPEELPRGRGTWRLSHSNVRRAH